MNLDLSTLGFRIKKEDKAARDAAPAEIAAVVLSTGDADLVESVQTVLKASGIDLPEHTIFEDGTVALHKQDDAFTDGSTMVRLNSTMAVALRKMDAHLVELTKSAMSDIAAEQGYFDGPSLVMDVAQESIRVGLQKAEGSTAASTLVQETMEGVNQYMSLMTKVLPSTILKSEVEVERLVKAFVPKKTDEEVAAEELAAAEEKAAAEKVKKADEAPVVAPVQKTEVAPVVEPVVAPVPAEVVAPVVAESDLQKVLKAVSDLSSELLKVSKSVSDLGTEVKLVKTSTEEKIDVLTKKADTAVHAVRGTVLSSEVPGDPTPAIKVKKEDSDPRSGIFDTAMIRR